MRTSNKISIVATVATVVIVTAVVVSHYRTPGFRIRTATYSVKTKVSAFPPLEDLTTPESAYAAIQRAYVAEGNSAWERLSVPRLRREDVRVRSISGPAPAPAPPLSSERAEMELGAEVTEVHVADRTNAAVFAQMHYPQGDRIDIRWLEQQEGRWLNCGNDVVNTLDAARKLFERYCARKVAEERRLGVRPEREP
jgi:hypothetical protein